MLNMLNIQIKHKTENLFIDKLTCSLVGTKGIVKLVENTHIRDIYNLPEIEVDYFCSYRINEAYQSLVLQDDLMIAGLDINNSIRVLEMKNHPFFIITAFVPQVDSSFEKANPLINEFVRMCNSN